MAKRLLLFAYFYPPLGGPAVQRPLKMVKYMHKLGWETDVITVGDIVYHSKDETLLDEDKSTGIYRTKSLDLMTILKKLTKKSEKTGNDIYFKTPELFKKILRDSFFIDDKLGWLPFALKQARKLCKTNKYDVVMATISPYTPALAAYKISVQFNLPLVLDYRDHWTLGLFKTYLTPIHKVYARKWESKILDQSSLIITAGRVLGNDLIEKFGNQHKTKIQVMYNGWDEIDFTNIEEKQRSKQTIISYIGGFYAAYSPKHFIQAMEELDAAGLLPADLIFRFIGNHYLEILELLKNNKISDRILLENQVEHKVAISRMINSDGLLYFIPDQNSKGIIAGKLFEYLRSGTPIFSMVPKNGESATLLRKSGNNYIAGFSNVEEIKSCFLSFYQDIKSKKLDSLGIDPIYNRENQTKLFVKKLEKEIEKN